MLEENKKLCELWGIEPKIYKEEYITSCYKARSNKNTCEFYSCGFGDEFCHNPEKDLNTGVYIKGICPQNIEFKVIPERIVYPDFEEPENFVKLLECKVNGENTLFYEIIFLGFFFNRDSFKLNVRSDFLIWVSALFNGYSDDFISIKKKDKMKQQIQQIDWKY